MVETARADGLSESGAEPFPFIAGFARARDIPVEWICFGQPSRASSPAYRLELTPVARERLLRQIDRLRAGRVLFSEAPARDLARLLRARRPRIRIRHCASRQDFYQSLWLTSWLGLPSEGAALPDLARPDYRAQALDPLPKPRQTPLIGSASCLYAAPLSTNPVYRDVDLSASARAFACAFCPGPADLKYPYRSPAIELAASQIAAARAEPSAVWSRDEFVVRSAALFLQMPRLLERLEAGGLGPVSLFFSARADEVLQRAEDVRRALSLARRAGHTIHIHSMGVENFSPAENERFNKRLNLAQIRAALALLREWEADFPETFFFTRHGGLGFILFTPWTTLEDLRANLAAARELGLEEDGFFLSRRLMLFKDMPITALAARDGLLRPRTRAAKELFSWLQDRCDPGCRHYGDEADIPWAFRDPVAAAVCALAARLALKDADVAGDPYQPALRAAVQSSGVRLLDAFELLLALAARSPRADLPGLAADFLGLLRRLPARREPFSRGPRLSQGSPATNS